LEKWELILEYNFNHGLVDCKLIRKDFSVFSDFEGGPSNLRKRTEKTPGGPAGMVLGGPPGVVYVVVAGM
jgi:hypothetical protein